MSKPQIRPNAINGVSLLTRAGQPKSRYSPAERLQLLGATQADLDATIRLFCPGRPYYAATRRNSADPRDWTTPRGRLQNSEVLRHLTGNLTPGILPRWIAPHSWEVTKWVGIDVDFRGDHDDFVGRCRFVCDALLRLGVEPKAVLQSVTPSGGRHFRFFLTRKVRVAHVPQVLALVGLQESPGRIEIFPKRNKGMRLPFGYVPGQPFEPRRWLNFIRRYRRRRFPRVCWLDVMKLAEAYAQAHDVDVSTGSTVPSINFESTCKKPARRRRINRISAMALGVPRRKARSSGAAAAPSLTSNGAGQCVFNVAAAKALWAAGIPGPGTRVDCTKKMAWHLLFVQRLSVIDAQAELVAWVYSTGQNTSVDVQSDLQRRTRKVEQQTRDIVRRMEAYHSFSATSDCSLSCISQAEVHAVQCHLGDEAAKPDLVDSAFRMLRYAKLHGIERPDGWECQIAVRGVIRKWPGCGGMKYKPVMDSLKRLGLVTLTKEKRQTSNGTGRPRTYLIRVEPSLRVGATLNHEQAVQQASKAATELPMAQASPVSDEVVDTYRRNIPPALEAQRTGETGVAQQGVNSAGLQGRPLNSTTSPQASASYVSRRRIQTLLRATQRVRLTSEFQAGPCRTHLNLRSSAPSPGPVEEMVTNVLFLNHRDPRSAKPRDRASLTPRRASGRLGRPPPGSTRPACQPLTLFLPNHRLDYFHT